MHRGPDGVMRYSGAYKCSGCPLEFTELASWRERGPENASTEASPMGDQPDASLPPVEQGGKAPRNAFALRRDGGA